MKKILLVGVLTLVVLSVGAADKVKTGFGFGALPAVSFDSDLGFQYGAIVNLYHYGDGSAYPKYDHSLYMEWSRYTKGTGINRVMYDSEKLLRGIRTTIDVTYLTDQMLNFYGFNGSQSSYSDQATRSFYSHERNMFRIKADLQGNFGASDFGWVGGYSFYDFEIGSVDYAHLDLEPDAGGSLYDRYVAKGVITQEEAGGGSLNYLKAGLKYDSRDQRAFPSRGMWTEAVIQTAPSFLNEMPHTKFALIHRQYFTLLRDMVFAYRLDYQTTLGDSRVPFYAQPLLITSFLTAASNQGLGGAKTLRGILRNRVVGDAVLFGNFELRYKFLKFNLLNQNFYLGTNLFFDSGMILKPMEVPGEATMSAADKAFLALDEPNLNELYSSAGLGLKIGWNENFVISVDHGRAFNANHGKAGTYITLNYLF